MKINESRPNYPRAMETNSQTNSDLTEPDTAESRSSMDDGRSFARVESSQGLSSSVAPTRERLSERRRDSTGKVQKPLTVKIINNAVLAEEMPLTYRNQPVTGSNPESRPRGETVPVDLCDNELDPSADRGTDSTVGHPHYHHNRQAPGGGISSNMTPSVHSGAHIHWGTVRQHIPEEGRYVQEEDEKKRRALDKWTAATVGLKSNVANFFGVGDEDEEARHHTLSRWRSRVERIHGNSAIVGAYKQRAETLDSVFEPSSGLPSPAVFQKTPQPYDPLARGHRIPASRQISRISTASSSRRSGRSQLIRKTEKDHVWKMAYDGVKHLVMPSKPTKKPSIHSRSIMPNQLRYDLPTPSPTANSVFQSDEASSLDDVFFDSATPTSAAVIPPFVRTTLTAVIELNSYNSVSPFAKQGPVKPGWQTGRSQPEPGPELTPMLSHLDSPFSAMKRIPEQVVQDILDDPNKRQIGKGFAGFLTDAEYRKSRLDSDIRLQMAEMDDHRPFFTYWVTFVQIVCYIIAVSVYRFSTIGFSETKIEGQALMPSLAIEHVSYVEEDNMWIGPRQADLIHLGAKYSPCMRKDENIEKALAADHDLESQTACCVRVDGSGCVQTLRQDCSRTLSDFISWNKSGVGPNGRRSGSVCGLDPRFCNNPKSMPPYEWADNISKWPHCREPKTPSKANDTRHMTCAILGRPCCIGIQGQCLITTREHCTFLRGYFYQNHTLCSQISCMNEICGMSPFMDPDIPDQFYRLFTSLFIHAGLLQLAITVLFQVFLMRDLEKLAGSLRIGIIYIGSGLAGSLSSAIFLPYHVEAGPSGSQFGLLACIFVEIIQNWYILKNPGVALGKLGFLLLSLFAIGLLPMVDNYAHLIGFVFGFLLSFALLPYITFNLKDKRGKLIGVIVCLVAVIGLFAGLVILFYVFPVYNCPNCHYFNCIPFTPNFCKSMEVSIRR